jgi:N-acyl-D-aspartate/D-glutamate deacylase
MFLATTAAILVVAGLIGYDALRTITAGKAVRADDRRRNEELARQAKQAADALQDEGHIRLELVRHVCATGDWSDLGAVAVADKLGCDTTDAFNALDALRADRLAR